MAIDSLKGLPENELVGKLNQLSEQNFNARFTTEGMTPVKGAEVRARRREIARVRTVMNGRTRFESATAELKATEQKLAALAEKPNTKTVRNAERKLRRQVAELTRTVKELKIFEKK